MKDVEGKPLTPGSKVVYAVGSGRSSGTLRVALILELNPKTHYVKVEIQGPLSEWERRTLSTPYRADKFYVVDTESAQ